MVASLFSELIKSTVSPYEEMLAYEFLYSDPNATLKRISGKTVGLGKTPSEVLKEESGLLDLRESDRYKEVQETIDHKLGTFDVIVNGTPSWPASLKDSARPVPVLYYRGAVSLLDRPSVSVVGSRKASQEGKALAAKIAAQLSEHDVSVVTGMARGIDTAATEAALEYKVGTIGVIGTPVDEVYPPENIDLFNRLIENEGLIVSQVPFYKYQHQPFDTKRFYFPERNELMAAISNATIIVEASDTSGTLTQARACEHQGRPLFITSHACSDPSVTWPSKWLKKPNVFEIDDAMDVLNMLGPIEHWGGGLNV